MIQSIRGFRDIIHPDSALFTSVENKAREIFRLYGYHEIRLPTVERKELFVKSTGETTDIVEKEMYSFKDAGDRDLALRPEGTPGVVRAYLEKGMHAGNPRQKFFYIGNMFRAERPQAGRYREFEQIGAEYLGNASPAADAEVMLLLAQIIRGAGVASLKIELNSLGCQECRPAYRQALLDYLIKNRDTLCDNCKSRIERNPLRALDCKIDGPRLAESAPKQQLCPACAGHFDGVKAYLDAAGEKYVTNSNLVRGLDYYTRTVFEFKSAGLGSQDTIAAGGRYDTLVKSMDGPDVPAVGWGMGLDRVVMSAIEGKTIKSAGPEAFVVSMDDKCNQPAFSLLQSLRAAGVTADGGNFGQSFKSQMRAASRAEARCAVIIGEDEVKNSSCAIKTLETGEQKTVPAANAADEIKNLRKQDEPAF